MARVTQAEKDKRLRILDAALQLFREQGFEQTTMREIAAQAEVALGLAYYHFGSKEALVMAFYDRATEDIRELAPAALAGKSTLKERVKALFECKLTYFRANKRFLGALLNHSADPEDPLSPFSEATKAMREADIAYFAEAIAGSNTKVHDELKPVLPKAFWLFQLGIILFWLYDRSPGERKTTKLIDKSLDLVMSLIQLARLPTLSGARKLVIELVETIA
jgi:AcrR family transcriptional regulator